MKNGIKLETKKILQDRFDCIALEKCTKFVLNDTTMIPWSNKNIAFASKYEQGYCRIKQFSNNILLNIFSLCHITLKGHEK